MGSSFRHGSSVAPRGGRCGAVSVGRTSFRAGRGGWLFAWAVCLGLFVSAGWADDDEDHFVAIRGATILTVTGEEIENGVLVLRNGKVDAVGKKVEIPRSATVIEADGQVVMPGLIDPRTRFGLRNYNRTGVKANLGIDREMVLDAEDLRPLLEAGFTTLGVYPAGRGFPGAASAIRPHGEFPEGMKQRDACYVRVTFDRPSSDKQVFLMAFKQARAEIEKVEKARKAWEEKKKKEAEAAKKKAEADKKKKEGGKPDESPKPKEPTPKPTPSPKSRGTDPAPKPNGGGEKKKAATDKKSDEFKPPAMNPAYVPLVDILQKKPGVQLFVEMDDAGDVVHWADVLLRADVETEPVFFVNNRRRFSSFFSSGVDLNLAVETLGESDPKILLYPTLNRHMMTTREMNLPLELIKEGCTVGFVPVSDTVGGHRSYLSDVTSLVRAGLTREEALRGMTLNVAAALGLGESLGSIEKGKDGDLLFLSHDPFDPRARVVRVMVKGETVAEPFPWKSRRSEDQS